MQTIDQIFSDFPQKTVDLRQKVKSGTGKSASSSVTKTGLKVFLQADGGDLDSGIVAGSVHRIFISQEQLGSTALDYGDELIIGSNAYVIFGLMLEDGSPDIEAYYELECKKT
jgi:hypothetical protein